MAILVALMMVSLFGIRPIQMLILELLLRQVKAFLFLRKLEVELLHFPSAIRSIGTADDFIAGRRAVPTDYCLLKIEINHTDSKQYFTDLYFTDNASLGLDPGYDSAMFDTSPDFSIFSHLVENNTGIDYCSAISRLQCFRRM